MVFGAKIINKLTKEIDMSPRAAFDTTAADIAAVMSNFRQTLIRYEGQVEQLIQENEALKKEIENLKKSAETKDNK